MISDLIEEAVRTMLTLRYCYVLLFTLAVEDIEAISLLNQQSPYVSVDL